MKIVIWTGPAWETWGPQSLDTGLGGSEIAAIHMSSELARWGHEVEVIGQVTPCEWQKVKFVDYHQYAKTPCPRIECDVFVSSRHLSALTVLKPDTKLSALWCHDIHVGDDWQNLMCQYDIVLCLSKWSRKTMSSWYSNMPKERFVVTRNGIDPRLFLREPKKDGCKIIYSSSPDRGLNHLLDWWPTIQKMKPDAELHVYYGFVTWREMALKRNDQNSLAAIDFLMTRLEEMRDQGVHSHGRVGQVELTKAWLKASMWLYPTAFMETSCISAMEAQAAGALPVATKLAALTETVRHGILVNPPNTDTRYEQEFLSHVRKFVERAPYEIELSSMLHAGREWALRNLSWTQVAEQWETLFTEKLRNT